MKEGIKVGIFCHSAERERERERRDGVKKESKNFHKKRMKEIKEGGKGLERERGGRK